MRQQIADIIEAKVGYTNGWAIPHVEWSDKALEAADEILALTSRGVAPDREALGRALYMLEGGTAECWNDIGEVGRAYYRNEAHRLVRVLGGFPAVPSSPDAEMERQMQEAWRKDLEDAVADAIHTLTNEVRAGTVFNEAGLVHGTLAMLKRVDPCLRETATPLYAGPPVDHSQEG